MSKILLIEDQLLWQRVLKKTLEREKHQIEIAGSYNDAYTRINSSADISATVDLILLDLALEGRDVKGKELLPLINSKNTSGKVKVLVFMSEPVIDSVREILVDYRGTIIDFFDKQKFGDGEVFLKIVQQNLSQAITGSLSTRIQNPRDFTVQIRKSGTQELIGTGIVISSDGKILTCGNTLEKIQEHVDIYFPRARRESRKVRQAKVLSGFEQYDDDVVLLQILDSQIPLPLAQEHIAVLGNAKDSAGNPFRAYGYQRMEGYRPGYAQGLILGEVEPPEDLDLQADPIEIASNHINRGMNGAAVIDTERNLVVGLVSENWGKTFFRYDSPTAWAVNTSVLSLEPFHVPVRKESLELCKIPKCTLSDDLKQTVSSCTPSQKIVWYDAPGYLANWVGRTEILKNLSDDWKTPGRHVTGLIGFGGEGKSSLARKWVDELLENVQNIPDPDGIFWWGFYTRRDMDDFLESALRYLSADKIDLNVHSSANAKLNALAGFLQQGKYLFILDGLEEIQYQQGDGYGMLRNEHLRQFLSAFCVPGSQSFCLITSRLPVLDLIDYTGYMHRDVTCLNANEGIELFQKLGIKGEEILLEKIVDDWEGHALTLTLIAMYLLEQYDGDISYVYEISAPTSQESRYERVKKVLRQYEKILSEAERSFLMVFSAFRIPVKTAAFEQVFRGDLDIQKPLVALGDSSFKKITPRLVNLRLLQYDPDKKHYTAHPLVHGYYHDQLNTHDPKQIQELQQKIEHYYLTTFRDNPSKETPTLEDLSPLIEAVHHACQAGEYDEAFQIYRQDINLGEKYLLSDILGAWDTNRSVMLEFFPERDFSQIPQVNTIKDQGWILSEVGFCLMSLGQLEEAKTVYAQSIEVKKQNPKDKKALCVGYEMVAQVAGYLGYLEISKSSAAESLTWARQSDDQKKVRQLLVDQAWFAHLRGDIQAAQEGFQQALELQQMLEPEIPFLYRLDGTEHAYYLWRTGAAEEARKAAEANWKICTEKGWLPYICHAECLFGDMEAAAGQQDKARHHYENAVKIARATPRRDALILALLARGKWSAHHQKDVQAAFSDLQKILDYACYSGYRLYEADIRVALAYTHEVEGDRLAARQAAEYALRISEETGYYWGKKDAEAALSSLV